MRTFSLLLFTMTITAAAVADDSPIRFEKHHLSHDFYSEGANIGDFNRDGKMDVVSGPFWHEGPEFQTRHAYASPTEPVDPHTYSKFFFAFVDDFNHDGWPDILSINFPGEDASWFENPRGQDRAWDKHLILAHIDDESPTYVDLLGDGNRKLVCINDGRFGYAARDPSDPAKPWTFHAISPKSASYQRFPHGLGVGDLNGDGRLDVIERTGWWQQPASLAGDPIWQKHDANFGDGGAQMYACDVNGDGRADVITSLQAHGYGLAWFEQNSSAAFVRHLIMGAKPDENPQGVAFSQPHAIAVTDIDGDGLPDIVTGKRFWAHGPDHDPEPNAPAVLYWFQCRRSTDGKVEFIAHKIDDDSGVGTQVVAAEVNGDGLMDIVVGNKKGTFVFVQKR